jgi:hypothetical protein
VEDYIAYRLRTSGIHQSPEDTKKLSALWNADHVLAAQLDPLDPMDVEPAVTFFPR